jgi:CPA2 family monovalent cation:H+ antiporter-2
VAVVVLTLVVIVGKIVGVAAGAFLTGSSTHTSLQAGMSLAQIGEFSFIIAALGASLKVTGSFLYPVAVAVSAVTTLSTPWLIRASGPVASFVDRKLPPRLQTVVSLYGSWLEALRNSGRARTAGSAVWRMVLLLLIDAALLVGIIIGTSLFSARLAAEAHERVGIDVGLAKILILGVAAGLAFPFCFGMVQVGRRAGATLAEMALPRPVGATTDLAMAPRKVLTLVFQLATALLLGVPLVAITQPFLPGFPAAVLVVIGAAMLAIAFWRSASNLEGHVRAGAQVVMEALRQQARSHTSGDALQKARQLLPGMGEPVSVTLDAQSPALGRTLAELNLRGMTGATVLAISRNAEELVIPQADEVLKEGDVLALVGSREAISASKTLLGCA